MKERRKRTGLSQIIRQFIREHKARWKREGKDELIRLVPYLAARKGIEPQAMYLIFARADRGVGPGNGLIDIADATWLIEEIDALCYPGEPNPVREFLWPKMNEYYNSVEGVGHGRF